MAKVVFNEDLCKGCSLCVEVCPVGIIELKSEINKSGFHPATITDMSKCTGCTSCALICPDTCIEIWK
ncbi:MAG: 4Fe-4S binding protein [Caldisericia bacterium]|nr:4Fe-4S binding protein [Caldisericia bacterium]